MVRLEQRIPQPDTRIYFSSSNPTDLDPLGPDVEHPDHTGDEGSDGFEVETSDTPGAVHQDHDVGLSLGLTPHV